LPEIKDAANTTGQSVQIAKAPDPDDLGRAFAFREGGEDRGAAHCLIIPIIIVLYRQTIDRT